DRAPRWRRPLPKALPFGYRDRRRLDAVPRHQSRQAEFCRRLQEPGRSRNSQGADRPGRCAGAEFPARRHQPARPRLRSGQENQPAARLRLDHRLQRTGPMGAATGAGISGEGAHIETSLLEALVDYQFEVLTTYLNDGQRLPKRSEFRNAHAYLAAPYGVYPTADSYLALAMMPLDRLAPLLDLPEIAGLGPKAPFLERDRLKRLIADRLLTRTTDDWVTRLDAADIWCAKVLNWTELLASDGFRLLDMLQTVTRDDGIAVNTTRSPLRINGSRARTERGAPRIGEHSAAIRQEFGL